MWYVAGDVWKYICDYSAYIDGSTRGSTSNRGGKSYASSHDRPTQRQKNVFEFIQHHHTPPDPKVRNNIKTTRPDKNENCADDEFDWNQTDKSAQNEATNENGSQRGAQAKKTAQKGAAHKSCAHTVTHRPDPKDHNNVNTTSTDKNENWDDDGFDWNQNPTAKQDRETARSLYTVWRKSDILVEMTSPNALSVDVLCL